MEAIHTNSGKVFSVRYCGVSSFDNRLRFTAPESSISEIFNVFSSASETSDIEYWCDGEMVDIFTGYTELEIVSKMRDGISVTLAKSTNEHSEVK